jgi:hypothetical protein
MATHIAWNAGHAKNLRKLLSGAIGASALRVPRSPMKDRRLRACAEAHIAAMARRTSADHDRLADILRGWCWPGGPEDRTEPVARGWVRQWGRACAHTVAVECTCAQGRCAACN